LPWAAGVQAQAATQRRAACAAQALVRREHLFDRRQDRPASGSTGTLPSIAWEGCAPRRRVLAVLLQPAVAPPSTQRLHFASVQGLVVFNQAVYSDTQRRHGSTRSGGRTEASTAVFDVSGLRDRVGEGTGGWWTGSAGRGRGEGDETVRQILT